MPLRFFPFALLILSLGFTSCGERSNPNADLQRLFKEHGLELPIDVFDCKMVEGSRAAYGEVQMLAADATKLLQGLKMKPLMEGGETDSDWQQIRSQQTEGCLADKPGVPMGTAWVYNKGNEAWFNYFVLVPNRQGTIWCVAFNYAYG